jgi:hypothetical protein
MVKASVSDCLAGNAWKVGREIDVEEANGG